MHVRLILAMILCCPAVPLQAPAQQAISAPLTPSATTPPSASAVAKVSSAAAAPSARPNLWPEPDDAKALKSYQEGLSFEQHYRYAFALDDYKKADKETGNRCLACAHKVLDLATTTGDYKLAQSAAQELIVLATTPDQQAAAHVERAQMLLAMGKAKKKPECFSEGEQETVAALASKPGYPSAIYVQGVCLASLQQDDAAKQIFMGLLSKLPPHSVHRDRVARFAERPELVRARMAPAFSFTTADGQRVTFDSLRDKVVLIDFWATWCGSCRLALPQQSL